MWQLGEDNWIKYGWGENFSKDRKPGDTFYIDFRNRSLPEQGSSVEDNAKITVNNIIKSYPPPYTLMCSGGADSQAMIWAWIVSGVPFNIVSIRYISEGIFFNEHDLITLDEYAKKLNLSVDYKDFDVIDFIENNLSEYANEYDCASPQICTHMKMSELVVDGTILFSGNFLVLQDYPVATVNYVLLGLSRYSEKISTPTRTIIPFFLMHNSKLGFSFPKPESYTKDDIYISVGIPLCHPPNKYNGFEKLKEYYDKYYHRVNYKSRLLFKNKPSRRVFDLLFRYPYEKVDVTSRITPAKHLI